MADPQETAPPRTWMQTDLGLSFFWDVRKLWAVDLPVAAMPVRDLEWLLDRPFWKDGRSKLALRPRDVAANPERYQADYKRAMAADLSCPMSFTFVVGGSSWTAYTASSRPGCAATR